MTTIVEMLDKYYNTDCPCDSCVKCGVKEECPQIEGVVVELEDLLKAFFEKTK